MADLTDDQKKKLEEAMKQGMSGQSVEDFKKKMMDGKM